MSDFLDELKPIFLGEVKELYSQWQGELAKLDQDAGLDLSEIYRAVHTMKGSGETAGFDAFGAFAKEVETFVIKLKNSGAPVSADALALLHRADQDISAFLQVIQEDASGVHPTEALVADLNSFAV